MAALASVEDRNLYKSCRSFFAPVKLEPLSLWIELGSPLLETNLFKLARKASVVKSLTTSM